MIAIEALDKLLEDIQELRQDVIIDTPNWDTYNLLWEKDDCGDYVNYYLLEAKINLIKKELKNI